jgi:hypothetical protein
MGEEKSGGGNDQAAAISKYTAEVVKERSLGSDGPDRRIRISPNPTAPKAAPSNFLKDIGKSQDYIEDSTSTTTNRTQTPSSRDPVSPTTRRTRVRSLKSDHEKDAEARTSTKRSASDAFPDPEQRAARSGFNFIGFGPAAHHTRQSDSFAIALEDLSPHNVAVSKPQTESSSNVEPQPVESKERVIVIE